MTRFTFQFITGLGLAMSATLNPAFSETLVNGGVIHFHGAIVSNPCEITARPQQLSMSCPENNRMQTRVLSYADALNGQSAYPDLASVSMKYGTVANSRW